MGGVRETQTPLSYNWLHYDHTGRRVRLLYALNFCTSSVFTLSMLYAVHVLSLTLIAFLCVHFSGALSEAIRPVDE